MIEADKEEIVEESIVLRRLPPGDRWETAIGDSKQFSNLTSALDHIFNITNATDFNVYARKGIVCIKKSKVIDKPITKYSLYGEE